MKLLGFFTTIAALAFASRSIALERTSIVDSETQPAWASSSTCALIYYNRCTGWSWAWGGFPPFSRTGVFADACCAGAVRQTVLRVFTGAPGGYGFTGTASIMNAGGTPCPTGVPIASQPWLPSGPFDVHNWNAPVPVTGRFIVMYTWGRQGAGPARIASDHPAHGPTGPQACGFCYPLTRVNRSYYWGTAATPVCPGSPFYDGVCDAQFRLDIYVTCAVAVEPETWTHIKELYR